MSRPIAVLRPEPGNRVTAAAIEARGRTALRFPLFETKPIPWDAPNAARFDALITTSANVFRHGGPQLDALRALPVHAVGEVTAESARRAGFAVASIGDDGAAELLANAAAAGVTRALHLAGRERTIEANGIVAEVCTVYASDALPARDPGPLGGSVALVQSARAAERFADLVPIALRGDIAVVAVSARAARSLGGGWECVVTAPAVDSVAMIEAALALAD